MKTPTAKVTSSTANKEPTPTIPASFPFESVEINPAPKITEPKAPIKIRIMPINRFFVGIKRESPNPTTRITIGTIITIKPYTASSKAIPLSPASHLDSLGLLIFVISNF